MSEAFGELSWALGWGFKEPCDMGGRWMCAWCVGCMLDVAVGGLMLAGGAVWRSLAKERVGQGCRCG